MYLAFLVALPFGFYMLGTPRFWWYGSEVILYLITAILMSIESKSVRVYDLQTRLLIVYGGITNFRIDVMMQPDIPFTEYEKQATRDVYIVIEPIALKIEQGDIEDARHMLARLTLWFLDQIEKGELEPWKARNAYFLLNVYLIDNYPGDILGEEAQELIYEGTLLHEYGQEMGPDVAYMRKLASDLLGTSNPNH
jgi:hypothetical protein